VHPHSLLSTQIFSEILPVRELIPFYRATLIIVTYAKLIICGTGFLPRTKQSQMRSDSDPQNANYELWFFYPQEIVILQTLNQKMAYVVFATEDVSVEVYNVQVMASYANSYADSQQIS
jgi:hypothetical protein